VKLELCDNGLRSCNGKGANPSENFGALQKEESMTTATDRQTSQTPGLFDDVLEIRECRVAEANQLLNEGWQLQGIYNWSQRQEGKKPGESSYMRRAVVYVLLRWR
jgi:hypothetical protein